MSNLPPFFGITPRKRVLILDIHWPSHGGLVERFFLVGDGLAAYQLVGGVMAYQGFDG